MFRKFSQSKNTGPFLIVIASLLSVLLGVEIGSGIQHFYSISQTAHAANYPPVTERGCWPSAVRAASIKRSPPSLSAQMHLRFAQYLTITAFRPMPPSIRETLADRC